MKKIYLLLLTVLFVAATTNAQLTGIQTVPGSYPTIAAAVADLNAQGVGAGGVIFNVAAGHSETAPVGGINLTATGTAANTIVFQKSGAGANPLINAQVGTVTLTTTSATVDGIFSFNGSDYVTIDGIDLMDNNASGPDMMEFGYGFFKASATNGCQNNTIKNCVVSLNKDNNVAGTTNTFQNGSRGVYLGNVIITDIVTDLVIATAAGRNDNNTITGNTIQNCFQGIYIRGYGDGVSPYSFIDQNNSIGGNSAGLGNIIRNFGTGTNTGFGISTFNQNNLLIQHNNVNNLAGGGSTHDATIVGISASGSFTLNNSTYDIKNNTVTLGQGTNTGQSQGISIGTAGGTGTVTISDNLITGFTNTSGATGGAVFGTVVSNSAGATLNIVNNTYSNNQMSGGFIGVSLQGTATAAIANINGNSFINNIISFTGTAAPISANALVTSAININNNIVDGITISQASTVNNMIQVGGGAAGCVLNVNGNSFKGISFVSTTQFLGIFVTSSFLGGNITLNNNLLGTSAGNCLSFSAANSTLVGGIYNQGGSSTTNLTMTGNDFRGFVHSVLGSSSHTYLLNSFATLSQNISNNTFTNLNINTTGSATLITNSITLPANGIKTINNNSIVTGFSKTGAGGTVTLYTDGASDPSTATNSVTNNNFSNITVTGATTVNGIVNTNGGSPAKNIIGNTISNITGGTNTITAMSINFDAGTTTVTSNTISNITGAGAITGILFGSSGTNGTTNASLNTVHSLTGSGTGAVTGITLGGVNTTTRNLFRNKIYNLENSSTSTGTVNGILISSGALAHNVYNNLIGDLRAPSANNTTDAVRGINITSTTTLSNINLSYNTINLNAISTGTNFSTSGVFHTFSTTATTAALNLRNNIIVNNSVPNGTGLAVALRRSAATNLNNFNLASDRNLFFAGAPCTNRLIYYDGTNSDQTLTAYKTRVAPRDVNSVTEDPAFLSMAGASATFLHINPAIATLIESGAATIAAITDDYDGDIRGGTPDIGADEFTGTVATACAGTPLAGTISPASSIICANQTTTLCLSGQTAAAGISVQWASSTTSGGPYTPIACAGGNCYNTGFLAPGTYYFVAIVTCANGAGNAQTPQATVVVNAQPTITVTPPAPTICAGGTGVSLTASGASTYTWSPGTGLSSTTGATVTANPIVTTTYTVTGVDGNLCSNTAMVTVTVNPSPVISSTTATPSTICIGSSSQLQTTAAYNSTVNTYSFADATGATLDPMAGATQVLGSGNDDTPTAAPAGIGFTFNYDGINYTQYSVSPDGWILLGSGVASNQFTNAVTSTTNVPKIYPYWDDLATGTTGNVNVLVTGSAPNRIFIVQWFVTIPRNTTGAANSTFQAWLYEGSNRIEFRYGAMGPGAMTASVGLTGITPSAPLDFNCVTLTTNTNSTTVANDNNAIQPPTGTMYTFTPLQVTSYAWTPVGTLNNPAIANPMATPLATQAYNVVVTGSNGCSATDNVTVTVSDNTATINYAGSPYCSNAGTATVTQTGAAGGTYSAPAGLSLNASTGDVNLSASTAGTFTVTYTNAAVGPCPLFTTTASITITEAAAATISYAGTPFCANAGTASVTQTGTAGGTYTAAPAGLTLNAATGDVTLGTSTPGAYTVTYTILGGGGCATFTTTAPITVNPVPSVSGSITQPTTCVTTDGAIDLTVIGAPTFTYFWTTIGGSGIVQGMEDQTGLTVGQYTVLVTDGNGCQETAVFNLTGPGGCAICPTIGTVTAVPSPGCSGQPVTLTASGLTSMGVTYGITFKSSLVALPDPYVGGTVIGTVPNGSLTSGGTVATLITSFPTANTYFIYAILDPTPTDPLCRPAGSTSLIINPTPTATIVTTPGTLQVIITGNGSWADEISWTLRNNLNTIILSGGPYGFNPPPTPSATAPASNAPFSFFIEAQGTFNDNSCLWEVRCDGNVVASGCIRGTSNVGACASVGTLTVPNISGCGAAAAQTICSGAAINPIAFTSTVPGTVFNWTRDNTATVTGIAASGTSNPITGTLTNTTNAPITVTFTITPTANGCTGSPVTATVTVNPTPNAVATPASQTICSGATITPIVISGAVTGTTYSWTRNNTATVTGIAASGTGNINGALTNTTNAPVTVTFTITPTANGCPGPTSTATVLVNPTPTVSQGSMQVIITGNGSWADEITWTLRNNLNAIILSGGPYGFNPPPTPSATVSAANAPFTFFISAQGTFNDNSCLWEVRCDGVIVSSGCIRGTANTGACASVGTLTVPNISGCGPLQPQAVCSGSAITPIVLGGPVAGTVFNWTRDNVATVTGTIGASGTGTISGTLINATNAPIIVTFTITPSANGCTGPVATTTVTVNPIPNAVAAPTTQTICSGTAMTPIVMSGNVSGTTYNWTRNNTVNVTGIAASGSGNISGTLTNTTTAQQTVTFTITPTANGCPGTPVTATVIVQAPVAITCPANITVPSVVGGCTAVVTYATVVTGTPAPTVTYSLSGATIGSGNGNGSGSSFNVGTTTVTVTASNSCNTVSCSFTITVTDSQLPVISGQPGNSTACVGTNASFTVVSTNAVSYQWQLWNGTAWVNINGATASTLTLNGVTFGMNTNSYRVMVIGLCTTVTSGFATLYVNQLPTISLVASGPLAMLPGQLLNITTVVSPGGGSYVWRKNGVVIAGQTGPSLTGLSVSDIGTYTCTYTDLNGCVATSAPMTITGQVSDNVWIYPNPNSGNFHVRVYNQANEQITVRVFDTKGAMIYQQQQVTTLPYTDISINLEGKYIIASANYIVDVREVNGRLIGSKKIQIRQ